MFNMGKYYDQRCPDCDGCGWLREGRYVDGRPYECCGWYGYILHESVMDTCEGFMAPESVSRFMSQGDKKDKRRNKHE